ncbi:hypothetical protein ACJX0J_040550 [Zea mays]
MCIIPYMIELDYIVTNLSVLDIFVILTNYSIICMDASVNAKKKVSFCGNTGHSRCGEVHLAAVCSGRMRSNPFSLQYCSIKEARRNLENSILQTPLEKLFLLHQCQDWTRSPPHKELIFLHILLLTLAMRNSENEDIKFSETFRSGPRMTFYAWLNKRWMIDQI